MSEGNDISVVIPHYGDPAETIALVQQLLAEPCRDLAAIIVSDDHSPRPYPADVVKDRRLRVVRKEANGGFGSAVNHGLSFVTTPWALIVNSDARVTAAHIEELARVARSWYPAVIAPHMVGLDGHAQYTARLFPTAVHQIVEWLTPLARFRHLPALHRLVGHDMQALAGDGPRSTDWVYGAVMLLPVAQVRRAGGFDEGYFMNAEEVDLQRRLREWSIPSLVLPSLDVTHEGGASSASELRRSWLVAARDRYARKWGHARALRAGLYAASAVNAAVNAVRELFGREVRAGEVFAYETSLIRGDGGRP